MGRSPMTQELQAERINRDGKTSSAGTRTMDEVRKKYDLHKSDLTDLNDRVKVLPAKTNNTSAWVKSAVPAALGIGGLTLTAFLINQTGSPSSSGAGGGFSGTGGSAGQSPTTTSSSASPTSKLTPITTPNASVSGWLIETPDGLPIQLPSEFITSTPWWLSDQQHNLAAQPLTPQQQLTLATCSATEHDPKPVFLNNPSKHSPSETPAKGAVEKSWADRVKDIGKALTDRLSVRGAVIGAALAFTYRGFSIGSHVQKAEQIVLNRILSSCPNTIRNYMYYNNQLPSVLLYKTPVGWQQSSAEPGVQLLLSSVLVHISRSLPGQFVTGITNIIVQTYGGQDVGIRVDTNRQNWSKNERMIKQARYYAIFTGLCSATTIGVISAGAVIGAATDLFSFTTIGAFIAGVAVNPATRSRFIPSLYTSF